MEETKAIIVKIEVETTDSYDERYTDKRKVELKVTRGKLAKALDKFVASIS